MKKSLSDTWYQLRPYLSILNSSNTTPETDKAVLAAATIPENSSSLLDVLCSPLTAIINGELSFLSLGLTLLQINRDISQAALSLENYTAIISQAAYLESIRDILSLYPALNYNQPGKNEELAPILDNINNIELDAQTAIRTIECFHESPLATAFNHLLSTRLISPHLSKYPARLLAKRIAVNTHRYIIQALIALDSDIQAFIPDSHQQWQKEAENLENLQIYLNNQIGSQLFNQVLDQTCVFKDIYIPPQAKPVNKYGEIDIDAAAFDIEAWVKKNILTENNSEKVIFIQGKIGRGKTVFCQVFADWVRHHLYPLWTPILINVKDMKTVLSQLEDTLKANLDISFIQSDDDWLKNKNTRFILIFDGWDELPGTVRNKHILETFIQQLAEFQQRCRNDENMKHRVLITSNNIPLSIISNLPTNLEKVEILPFDQQQQIKWLEKWQSSPDNRGEKPNLQELLASNKYPAIVKELIGEPLLLYLLAGMYRDDHIVIDDLVGHNYRTGTAFIHESAINWLITKLDHNFHDQSPHLRYIITQNAVDFVQSDGQFNPSAINGEKISTPWADFYIGATHESDHQIKFNYQCLTSFLFAERLKFSLISWTEYQETTIGKELITTKAEMNWQIYDLLGFGILSKDIVEYLLGLIIGIADFRWIQLYRRLENFYSSWCQGKFIDTAEETLAQIKLRSLQNAGIYQLGQRQVDIYAGLNVMILLLSIQRYAQEHEVLKEHIIFYPSGQLEGNNFTYQLQNIIHYSNCLDHENFRNLVGQFLSGTHLRGVSLLQINLSYTDLTEADLSRASLYAANFSYANLHCAYFIGTDLEKANFTAANLSETYLSGANLSGANLRDANLKDVDLSRANLSGADLRGANCDGANFMGAILSDDIYGDVLWDQKTNWKNTDGLEIAKNVPLALKKRLMTINATSE
jgi:uncharacterized protein YjbI with pentapeptide repeats